MTPLVAVTIDSAQITAGVVATAGLIGAAVYLGRILARVLTAVHIIRRIVERELDAEQAEERTDVPLKTVVNRELTHNHGSSLKDDVYGLAIGQRLLARQVDDLDERFTAHLEERSNQP